MTTPVAPGAAVSSQVMSAITLAASSDEDRFSVPSSRTPFTHTLDNCQVPCLCRPSSLALRLIAHEQERKARRREQRDESIEDLFRALALAARRRVAYDAAAAAAARSLRLSCQAKTNAISHAHAATRIWLFCGRPSQKDAYSACAVTQWWRVSRDAARLA